MQSEHFGRYQVVKPLGAGAMGAVYLARDELLGRDVAVKTIHGVPLTGLAGQTFRARFMNEARAVASLAHPNVVRVFDLGFEGETPFLVMEVVSGLSLKERLEVRGRVSPAEARALGVQLARALEAAHHLRILHRDLKPANVLEAEPGVWKLADFGVAHVPDSSLTISGQFLGSPAYAAPEALEAGAFAPASDVYGLGATLYEALSGEPPGGRGGARFGSSQAPRPLAELNPEVPVDLAAAIMASLARDPAARPTAAGLAERLSTGASVVPALPALPPLAPVAHAPRWRPGRGLVLALVAAVALMLGLVLGTGGGGRRPEAPATMPAGWPAPDPAASSRNEKQERRWRKAQEKLQQGDLDAAAKELEKLLERDPDDAEARALLDRVRAERGSQPSRRRGREDD